MCYNTVTQHTKTMALSLVSLFSGCGGLDEGFELAGFRTKWACDSDRVIAEVYKRNNLPVTVHSGTIAKVKEFPDADGVVGGPPCFIAGTKIVTAQGVKPIEFVTAGDSVLTHTGHFHTVLTPMKRKYEGYLYQVTTAYGRKPITCTPEHPFYVRQFLGVVERQKRYSEPMWLMAENLATGDLLCEPHNKDWVPLNMPLVNKKQGVKLGNGKFEKRLVESHCPLEWTDVSYAWVLGFYLAEGHTRGSNPTIYEDKPCRREVIFSIAHHEVELITKRLLDLGLHPQVQKHGQGCTRITVTNVEFWALCQVVGKGAAGKFIPETFHCMPLSWQKEFLEGCYSSNGGTGVVRTTTTVSRAIAEGIAKMVARVVGQVASICLSHHAGVREILRRKVTIKDTYRVSYVLPNNGKKRPGFVDDMGAWLPIQGVAVDYTECFVYNFEVDTDNSYVANGYSVHNCQSWSVAGNNKGYDDPRGELFDHYVRAITQIRPKFFLAENVPGLLSCRHETAYNNILGRLKALGYLVEGKVLNAVDYGVPQDRKRLFLLGYRDDLGISPTFPKPLSIPRTLRDALRNLPHHPVLSGRCASNYSPRYMSRNRVRALHLPSFTIVASASQIPQHPDVVMVYMQDKQWSFIGEPKRLSALECARIQTFPDSYCWDAVSLDMAYKMIGNAVPVELARHIALHIMGQLI